MYNRFFAFGCSFTGYYWPTWADIIGQEFGDNFYNLGTSGAGNEFMFHRLTEVHARYKINEKDLIIICWTNFAREDRYLQGKWRTSGNISSQSLYPEDWVRKWFDFRGSLIKTSSVIAGATHLLDSVGCEYMFTSMVPMNQIDQYSTMFVDDTFVDIFDVYKDYYKKIHVSMTEHLYGVNEFKNPKAIRKQSKNKNQPWTYDHHPSPIQHLEYVRSIILPNLKKDIVLTKSTINWVTNWQNRIVNNQPYFIFNDEETSKIRHNKWHKNMF